MKEEFSRTALLLGEAGVEGLGRRRVAVFGLGGVGGHCAEALARSGVGHLLLVDGDVVARSNLNRQIVATQETVGRPKAEAMRERILSILPDADVEARSLFYLPETADQIDLAGYDYIVDAVDTVSAKLELAVRTHALGIPLVSCMGAGNKLDPSQFRVSDIFETSGCPLARVMRRELRARGIPRLEAVWSPEEPRMPQGGGEDGSGKRTPGSVAFVPPAAGLLLAGVVVRRLAGAG